MGLVFPAQYKLVVILIEVAGQGHQVDLQFLQIVFTADDLFDSFALDDQSVGGIDFYQARRVNDLCCRVVGDDRIDQRA